MFVEVAEYQGVDLKCVSRQVMTPTLVRRAASARPRAATGCIECTAYGDMDPPPDGGESRNQLDVVK